MLYAHPLVEAGKKVTGGGDGMPTWVCEFMVTKPTVEEAIEFVTHIEHSLQARPLLTLAHQLTNGDSW